MKNVFDPHNNYDEWEENDWEYEEYRKTTGGNRRPEGKNDWKILLVVYFIIIILVMASCAAC